MFHGCAGTCCNAVETYANGITVDKEAVEDAIGRVDPTDPEAMRDLSIEGVFKSDDSPQQKAALARLETVARARRGLGLPRG